MTTTIHPRRKRARSPLKRRAQGESGVVGSYLGSLRASCGVTQEELSRKMGISRPNVSRLESPAYNMTLTQLLLYTAALSELGGEDPLKEFRTRLSGGGTASTTSG